MAPELGSEPTRRTGTIGVVGVGSLGRALTKALVTGSFSVVAFDLDHRRLKEAVAAGAKQAASLHELVKGCSIISVVVVDDEQVLAVVGEIIDRAEPATTVIIHSTVAPQTVLQLAEPAEDKGIGLLDVPVNGGWEKAELGKLMLLIGGAPENVERCRPVLEAIGEHLFHFGPLGAGAAAKLVNNLVITGSYAVMVEAMQLAAVFGIDEDTVTSFVTTGEGDSRQMRVWGRHDRTRRERALTGVDWADRMGRDLLEAARAAGERGLVLPIAASAGQMLPFKLRQRDRDLATRGTGSGPRCPVCNWELAAPFRAAGVHPECSG